MAKFCTTIFTVLDHHLGSLFCLQELAVIFSNIQINYINSEIDKLEAILKAKPQRGLIYYNTKLIALQELVVLHNMELREQRKNSS